MFYLVPLRTAPDLSNMVVQNRQRMDSVGMALRQAGQLRSLGLSTSSWGVTWDISLLIGWTTKKKITAAVIRNATSVLRKGPNLIVLWLIVTASVPKFGLPPIIPISGLMMLVTMLLTRPLK